MSQWTLGCQDVADLLGDVSHETVKRWAQKDRVPARKNAFGYWRFDPSDWPHSDPRRA